MRVTLNNISKAIKEETGMDIKLHRGYGYFHFYSDDDETGLMLMRLPSTSVYTNTLGSFSIEGWVEACKRILDGKGL